MSDLIKCEDVQREIQAMFDSGAFSWQEGQNLMDRINALPAASPWHRVEEPPKEDGKYLVYMFTSAWRWEFKFASYLHGRWIGAGGGDVCYWMPIEPPKEDE